MPDGNGKTKQIDWLRNDLQHIIKKIDAVDEKVDDLKDDIQKRDLQVEHRLTTTESRARTTAAAISAAITVAGGIVLAILK